MRRRVHRVRLFLGYRLGALSDWVLPWPKEWMEGRRRAYIERETDRLVAIRLAAMAEEDGHLNAAP